MDTDALLVPAMTAPDNEQALRDVIAANTAAFKIIRVALSTCNSQEKVQAIIGDVEQAMQDLSVTSQKVEAAVRKPTPQQQQQGLAVGYGQYPINQPFNPDNPVPWPPEYDAPVVPDDPITQLNYDYESYGGSPPFGCCYQTQGQPQFMAFSYHDSDTNNQATFLQSVAVGDTISIHGTTWTVSAISYQPSAVVFTVTPASFVFPYGVTSVMFDSGPTKTATEPAAPAKKGSKK